MVPMNVTKINVSEIDTIMNYMKDENTVLILPNRGPLFRYYTEEGDPNHWMIFEHQNDTWGFSQTDPNTARWSPTQYNPFDNHFNDTLDEGSRSYDVYLIQGCDMFYKLHKSSWFSHNILDLYVHFDNQWYSMKRHENHQEANIEFVETSHNFNDQVMNVINHNMVTPNYLSQMLSPYNNYDEWSKNAWSIVDSDSNTSEHLLEETNDMVEHTPQTPKTPPPPACQRSLVNDFDEEVVENEQSCDKDCQTDVSDELSLSEEETGDEDFDINDIESCSSSSSSSTSSYDSYDDYYDEKRQDTNGEWYTRRQFYDYYGSDDAWDNLNPNVYHQYRYDDQYHEWHTKEEFYQHYGTYRVWRRMDPVTIMERRAIYGVYHSASYLPDRLQDGYIRRMLETYR